MDLAGLLLDEEGTFSLSGFQDFTVSAQPAPFTSLSAQRLLCWALPSGLQWTESSPAFRARDWAAAAGVVCTRGSGLLGPEAEPRGKKGGGWLDWGPILETVTGSPQ